MKAENLQDLFERGLEFAYDGEKQLLKALPKMLEAAQSLELRGTLEMHLSQTEGHVDRIEEIFEELNRAAAGDSNRVIESLIDESERMIKHIERSALLDAALISQATQVEHHEMALYRTLASYARVLGLDQAATLLQETLGEEQVAEQLLTRIAEASVNRQARGVVNTDHEFNFI